MKTIVSYIATPIFFIYYFLLLVIFHVAQVICHRVFGDNARRKAVDVLNYLLVKGLFLLGSRARYEGLENIPDEGPVIVVSNHQSALDIPAIIVAFRKFYPKFISKASLGKNLPSISYNLKHGKSALIERQNGSQSIKEIFKLGKLIEEHKYAACIFPEGTRSKNGKLRKFMPAGVNTLLRAAPSAKIIPFVINGHYDIVKNGNYPVGFGNKVTYKILEPVPHKNRDIEEVIEEIQSKINSELK